jgi:hypothetical protein
VRVGDDDEGKVSERLYAVREPCGEDREGEVCGREQLLGGERGSSVSEPRDTR